MKFYNVFFKKDKILDATIWNYEKAFKMAVDVVYEGIGDCVIYVTIANKHNNFTEIFIGGEWNYNIWIKDKREAKTITGEELVKLLETSSMTKGSEEVVFKNKKSK